MTWALLSISLVTGLAGFIGFWTYSPWCPTSGPLWPDWVNVALLVAAASALAAFVLALARQALIALTCAIVLFGGCFAFFALLGAVANADSC